MAVLSEAEVLRVFVGSLDKHEHRPLYKVIVEAARQHGMAGATVLKGVRGFGARGQVHAAKLLRVSENLPVVVEIVDTPERIEAFLPEVRAITPDGLVTVKKARMVKCRRKECQERL